MTSKVVFSLKYRGALTFVSGLGVALVEQVPRRRPWEYRLVTLRRPIFSLKVAAPAVRNFHWKQVEREEKQPMWLEPGGG